MQRLFKFSQSVESNIKMLPLSVLCAGIRISLDKLERELTLQGIKPPKREPKVRSYENIASEA